MVTFHFQIFSKQPVKTAQFVVLWTTIQLHYCWHFIDFVDVNKKSKSLLSKWKDAKNQIQAESFIFQKKVLATKKLLLSLHKRSSAITAAISRAVCKNISACLHRKYTIHNTGRNLDVNKSFRRYPRRITFIYVDCHLVNQFFKQSFISLYFHDFISFHDLVGKSVLDEYTNQRLNKTMLANKLIKF